MFIGGSTYKISRCTPPPSSFVFTYIFTKKHPCQRFTSPAKTGPHPLREILDPSLMFLLIKCTACRISGWNSNIICDSIKAIYPTQATLLLTDILFQYSLPKFIPVFPKKRTILALISYLACWLVSQIE